MKFRYYMRGFGAGLIVAVIVLMIAGRIQKNNQDYAVVSGNKETEQSGSVIAYTTDASTEENTSSEKQTEESKTDIKETEKETEKEAAKETTVTATQKQSEERTTTRPVVSVSPGNADGKTEIVFSGVYTAAQAADILYDAGIISDKTEFYTYMYTSGYDRKMKDGTYHLKAGDSYETIAKTITQSK